MLRVQKLGHCIYLNKSKFSTYWCMMDDNSVVNRKRDKPVRSGGKRCLLNVFCAGMT